MSGWESFWTSFLEHLKEHFSVSNIGDRINEGILQVQHYVQIGDVKLILTDAIIVTWISVAIMIILFALLTRKASIKPTTGQTFVEMLIGVLLSSAEGFGLSKEEARHIAPMIGTFAIMITGCNVISVFNVVPPAKNIGFPIAMALVAITYVIYNSYNFTVIFG